MRRTNQVGVTDGQKSKIWREDGQQVGNNVPDSPAELLKLRSINETQSIGSDRQGRAGSSVYALSPNKSGGGIRRLLGASEQRLAGIVEQKSLLINQRDNILALIELLDSLERQERENLEITKEVLEKWEDSVSATLPIIKDAHTTN